MRIGWLNKEISDRTIGEIYLYKLSVLFFFCTNVYGQQIARTYDLRSDKDSTKYFVGFGARDNTSVGHTFVVFGHEDEQKRASVIDLKGFYPEHAGAPIDNAKIINEIENSDYHIPDYSYVIFQVEKKDYLNARLLLKDLESNPGLYVILGSNCVQFVEKMIGMLGINPPSSALTFPYTYMTKFVDQLETSGLEYKGSNLLKVDKDSQLLYVYENKNDVQNSVFRYTGFGIFVYGETKNGKWDGPILVDFSLLGKEELQHWNNGVLDATKTEVIREGINTGGFFANYATPQEWKYSDGSKRRINIDTLTGNKISAAFENENWICEEVYANDFAYRSKCKTRDNSQSAEGDMQVIIEDGLIKNVVSSDNYILTTPTSRFQGSCHYRQKKTYCKGTINYANGDIYTGEMLDFKYHGWGKYSHVEQCRKFLGIRIGNCNNFTLEGSWSSGIFDMDPSGQRIPRTSPSDAVPDPKKLNWDVDFPTKPENDFTHIPQPSPEPNPSTPPQDPPVEPRQDQKAKKPPKIKPNNAVFMNGRWILL